MIPFIITTTRVPNTIHGRMFSRYLIPPLQPPPPPKGSNVTLTFLLETVGCTVLSKRAGNRAVQPTSSSNPQPVPELPT